MHSWLKCSVALATDPCEIYSIFFYTRKASLKILRALLYLLPKIESSMLTLHIDICNHDWHLDVYASSSDFSPRRCSLLDELSSLLSLDELLSEGLSRRRRLRHSSGVLFLPLRCPSIRSRGFSGW